MNRVLVRVSPTTSREQRVFAAPAADHRWRRAVASGGALRPRPPDAWVGADGPVDPYSCRVWLLLGVHRQSPCIVNRRASSIAPAAPAGSHSLHARGDRA